MDIPIQALPPQQPFVSPPLHERRGLMTALILMVLIALAVTAYVYFNPHQTPPASTLVPVNPQAAYDKNDLLGALGQLDQLLKTNPQEEKWLILKSLALSQKGIESLNETMYGPQAVAAAQQAIGVTATSSEAYRALGLAQEIQGEYAGAQASYEKARALDPHNAAVSMGEAHSAEMQGNFTEAQSLYRAALMGPSSFATFLGLARVLTATGHSDQAQTYFTSIYTFDKNPYEKAEAEYALAMSNLSKGGAAVSIAQTQLKEATQLVPFYLSPRIGLATALYASGDATSSYEMLYGVMDILGPIPPGGLGTYVQIKQDLEVIGDTTMSLAALQAAEASLAKETTVTATERKTRTAGFDAFITLLKKSVPATTKL